MDNHIQKCFEILEITSDATYDEAKRAYRDLAAMYHPDKHSGHERNHARATDKFKALNNAWTDLEKWYKEEQPQLDREKKEREEQEQRRSQREKAEQERQDELERQRLELAEKAEREETERYNRVQKDREDREKRLRAERPISVFIMEHPIRMVAISFLCVAIYKSGGCYIEKSRKEEWKLAQRQEAEQSAKKAAEPPALKPFETPTLTEAEKRENPQLEREMKLVAEFNKAVKNRAEKEQAQKNIEYDSTRATQQVIPQAVFVIKDKIIIDKSTNLVWTRNANISNKAMTWNNAKTYVENLNYAGYNDWRLPTKDEIWTLTKKRKESASNFDNVNGIFNLAGCYWSSTNDVENGTASMVCIKQVDWHQALINNDMYVWAVRDQ